jgi:hypothetical protein
MANMTPAVPKITPASPESCATSTIDAWTVAALRAGLTDRRTAAKLTGLLRVGAPVAHR